ncbi:MAG: hypothetical protein AAFU64_01385 [Bacteroidota bacterium]
MGKEVIIQGVPGEKIQVFVDGEIKEIQNELGELKALLQNLSIQNIQYADKIYNIEHIDEANFGFITGKKAFNEVLVRRLIESIAPYSPDAQTVLNYVQKNQIENWESQNKFARKAKEILAYSFVGVLGIQLSQLMAIGSDSYSEGKVRNYIDKCLYLAKRSLELVTFTYISVLWDYLKTKGLNLDQESREVLRAFFEDHFESNFPQKRQLLKTLTKIFVQHQLPLPYEEMHGFEAILEEESKFCQSLQALQNLEEKRSREEFDLLVCLEAEKNLSQILSAFAFLADYKMASIKQVGYKQLRNADPNYMHRYTALGIDNKANQDAEKYLYTPQSTTTDSVLIYKGTHYQKNMNLFPFVIDYNALTFESGAKVCFFQCRSINDPNILEYLFLEDGSIQRIELKNILQTYPNLNHLIADKDKFKLHNIDSVVLQFQEARQQILGGGNSDPKGDEFENLFD